MESLLVRSILSGFKKATRVQIGEYDEEFTKVSVYGDTKNYVANQFNLTKMKDIRKGELHNGIDLARLTIYVGSEEFMPIPVDFIFDFSYKKGDSSMFVEVIAVDPITLHTDKAGVEAKLEKSSIRKKIWEDNNANKDEQCFFEDQVVSSLTSDPTFSYNSGSIFDFLESSLKDALTENNQITDFILSLKDDTVDTRS
jgi:hypothetical protein